MALTHPFTPTYIAMVKAAEEIQAMRPSVSDFFNGDWLLAATDFWQQDYGGEIKSEQYPPRKKDWGPEGSKIASAGDILCIGQLDLGDKDVEYKDLNHPMIATGIEWCADLYNRNLVVWLPRLDQLLGMLGDFITWQGMSKHFDSALRSIGANPGKVVDWHEVALAVVMREKHGKTWNGTEWKKP